MTNQPNDLFEPARVLAVPSDVARPFWSVMVPTYNRDKYLEVCLRSILIQDPGPEKMQLCVVDNATSTYDVPALLKRLAGDRIEYVRHPVNIGGIRNINTCFANSRGHWVHVLHDDDMIMPGFYQAYEAVIADHPDASLIFSPILGIDQTGFVTGMDSYPTHKAGPIDDFPERQARGNFAPTPSVVIPRRIYESIGGYAEKLAFVPDWELAFRAAQHGVVVTLGLPYAMTRWHDGTDTVRLIKSTAQIDETKKLIDELHNRLPAEVRSRMTGRKYEWLANACTFFASKLAIMGEDDARIEQLRWANELDPGRQRLLSLWKARTAKKLRPIKSRLSSRQ